MPRPRAPVDLRVVSTHAHPSATELLTVRAVDVRAAYEELTERYRGYAETPTLEEALAELEDMIGLEPVKRQVREITAQLQVAQMRAGAGLPAGRRCGTSSSPARPVPARRPWRGCWADLAALGLLARPDSSRRPGSIWSASISARPRSGPTGSSTRRSAVCCSSTRRTPSSPRLSGGDAFGKEAVQTLLKRAEDDRERLVVVWPVTRGTWTGSCAPTRSGLPVRRPGGVPFLRTGRTAADRRGMAARTATSGRTRPWTIWR